MKVIYLVASAFSSSLPYNYHKEDSFLKDGYDVEIWSLVDFLKFGNTPKEYPPYVKYFDTAESVCKALKNVGVEFICFLQLPNIYKIFPIYRSALKYAKKCAQIDYVGAQFEFANVENTAKEKLSRHLTFDRFFSRIKDKLTYEYEKLRLRKYITYFHIAKLSNEPALSINHPDWDIYLDAKGKVPFLKKDSYIVFLDVCFTKHPDFSLHGIKTIDEDTYLRKMNTFFEFIEGKYNKKVVIAAHPQSTYTEADFNGREIYWKKSADLVVNASFSIFHVSNSVSFSIFGNIPMMFIYTDEFKENTFYLKDFLLLIEKHSKYFNAPFINIDNAEELSQLGNLKVDEEAYSRFKADYLLSKHPETSNYEKFKYYVDH